MGFIHVHSLPIPLDDDIPKAIQNVISSALKRFRINDIPISKNYIKISNKFNMDLTGRKHEEMTPEEVRLIERIIKHHHWPH